jgi:UDP-N-acetylmuramoyl-L-alanyl-D-glutamate--2,6-diaminopimelate ligase
MIAASQFPRPQSMPLIDHLAQLGVPLIDLTSDSRTVKHGSVFVAYPGSARDGRAFIKEAIGKGAAAVIWERDNFRWNEAWDVPNLGVKDLRAQASEIAGWVYGHPSEKLWMAGVTGTNGKTTVSQWIARALDDLGRKSAVIGTLGNGLVGALEDAKNTTPDAIVLQKLLADYLRRGAQAAAMEVSSHGLDQGRSNGIKFDCAVFTNLTRDHLDYHGTMEAYAEAKFRLFAARGLRHAVINVDDETGRAFAARLHGGALDVISYGRHADARVHAIGIAQSGSGVCFQLDSDWGTAMVETPVLGEFNVSNLLAVFGALMSSGSEFDDAVHALGRLAPVTGRLERIGGGRQPLAVIDYAHSPDALQKVLETLRPAVTRGGKLICVFGCGGDRDAGKRPMMGAIAAKLADFTVATSDNPRSEDPRAILVQVEQGIGAAPHEVIEDRQVAIYSALARAHAGDIVLIAGKGHETYQEIEGRRLPFSDLEVARAALGEKQ